MEDFNNSNPNLDAATCDESKCVSRGRSELYNGTFTCYGDDGEFYPRMCADGYLPVVVEEEPISVARPWVYEGYLHGPQIGLNETGEIPVRYFTCCPPEDNGTKLLSLEAKSFTRRCSDPIVGDVAEAICEDEDLRKHPIQMKPATQGPPFSPYGDPLDAFLCCDSDKIAGTEENYLGEAECVPYMRESGFVHAKVLPNIVGYLPPFECDFPGEDFVFPRPLDNGTVDDAILTKSYQCCRTGPPLPPFVEDAAFWMDTAFPVALFCVGIIASLLVVFGLSIPLLIELKKGTYRASISSQRSAKSRRRGGRPTYSTYNLYLVYLAIPDFINSLCRTILMGSMINQKIPSNGLFINQAPQIFYIVSNLWLNAIVLYQILLLLKRSGNAERVEQPSLTRVNVQALAVYFLATVSAALGCFLQIWISNPLTFIISAVIFTLPTVFFPIGYGIYAGILVCCRGYLKTVVGTAGTAGAQAKRTLAIFFFRIVVIFAAIWLPSIVLYIFGTAWGGWLANVLMGIQPIATSYTIFTKKDCKEYILDLVTMSYFFGERKCFVNKDAPATVSIKNKAQNRFNQTHGQTTTATVQSTTVSSLDMRSALDMRSSTTPSELRSTPDDLRPDLDLTEDKNVDDCDRGVDLSSSHDDPNTNIDCTKEVGDDRDDDVDV